MRIFGSTKEKVKEDKKNNERDQKLGLLAIALEAFLENPEIDDDVLDQMLLNVDYDEELVIVETIKIVATVRPDRACKQISRNIWYKNSKDLNSFLIEKFLELADELPVDKMLEYIAFINMRNSKDPAMDQELADKWVALVKTLTPIERSIAAQNINESKNYYSGPGHRLGFTKLDKEAARIWAETAHEIPKSIALKQAFNLKSFLTKDHPEWANKYLIDAAKNYLDNHVQDMSPNDFHARFKL